MPPHSRGQDGIGVFSAFSLYAALGVAITIFYAAFVPDLSGRSIEEGAAAAVVGGDASLIPASAVRSTQEGELCADSEDHVDSPEPNKRV